MTDFPVPLHALAILSLTIAGGCAVAIAADEIRRPQSMAIMTLVWPLCALFGGPLWLWGYLKWGRAPSRSTARGVKPFAVGVAIGTSHCGAGCTLGDIIAEWTIFVFPGIAAWFGWGWLFPDAIFAIWMADFALAFLLGIVFQYYSIKPMRNLSPRAAIVAALKADAASISSWQIGMYGVMALIQFAWFAPLFGGVARVDTPEFWFAMQIAMLAGFCTAYPVNWLLIRAGIKEVMG